MNVDVFDNRSGYPRVVGNVLASQLIVPEDGSQMHVCLTLHTGFDIEIEVETLKKLSRLVGEADKHAYVRKQKQKDSDE